MKTRPASLPPRTCRIVLVEPEPLVRLGLTRALETAPDLVLVGEAGNAAEAVRRVERLHPDIVLTEINLPGRSGLDLSRDIASRFRRVRVVFLSHLDARMYAHRALEAGAAGFVSKLEDIPTLLDTLRRVREGGTRIPPTAAGPSGPAAKQTAVSTLTRREFEVFRLIGLGMDVGEISRRLHISRKTVEAHREHLKKKLGLRSATALNLMAVRWVATEEAPATASPDAIDPDPPPTR